MGSTSIYRIVENGRISVEMIEKFYAAHIKNMIDASAVNVRRQRSHGRAPERAADAKRSKTARKFGTPKTRH